MAAYTPLPEAEVDFPPPASDAPPTAAVSGPQSKRSLSEILFPPQLSSFPALDPFAPNRPHGVDADDDSDESSASEGGDERYRDLEDGDEKALLSESGVGVGEVHWAARSAHSRVSPSFVTSRRGARELTAAAW